MEFALVFFFFIKYSSLLYMYYIHLFVLSAAELLRLLILCLGTNTSTVSSVSTCFVIKTLTLKRVVKSYL